MYSMYIIYKYIYYIYIVDTVLMLRCVASKKFLFNSSCGKLAAVIFYDIVGQVNVSGELKYDLHHATCKTSEAATIDVL